MKRGQFCRKFLSSAASNLVSFFFTFLFRVLHAGDGEMGTRRKIPPFSEREREREREREKERKRKKERERDPRA